MNNLKIVKEHKLYRLEGLLKCIEVMYSLLVEKKNLKECKKVKEKKQNSYYKGILASLQPKRSEQR